MNRSEYISISKTKKTLSFSEKVDLHMKGVTVSPERFREYLAHRYPITKLNPQLIEGGEYVHVNQRTGKFTRVRMFGAGALVDEKIYYKID